MSNKLSLSLAFGPNPRSQPILDGTVAPELRRALAPGGPLIAAGILVDRRGPVEQAFADAGLAVRESFEDDDWLALVLR